MDLLFVGSIRTDRESSSQRYHAFGLLGLKTAALDLSSICDRGIRRFSRRIGGPAFSRSSISITNEKLFETILACSPRVAWIEKGLYVQPETLIRLHQAAPKTLLVSYQDDNPFGSRTSEHSLWRDFVRCIPHYDMHFVKRPSDVHRFTMQGARRTEICKIGLHAPAFQSIPPPGSCHYYHSVSFIGTLLENSRRQLIDSLILRHGLDVHVYGTRWNRCFSYYLSRKRFHPPLPMEGPINYMGIIRGSRINLCLVSDSNDDEYTGRSLEIPAAGGFLLAKRTPMHLALYKEGIEAEFFCDHRELVEKCRYYLANETSRKAIASAGYERARLNGYTWTRALREAVIAMKITALIN